MTEFRCGWPMQLVGSTAVVYCTLRLCHEGPCCLTTGGGEVLAAGPRFAGVAQRLTPIPDKG